MTLQIELLESSFAQVQAQEAEFTTHFYGTLFADYPEVQPLFAHTAMPEQAKKLFKSLVFLVKSLREPEALTQGLQGLGSRHVQYGVLPEHYPMVGSALLTAFAICLAEGWTPAVEQAWRDAYATVTEVMLSGTEYPETILTPCGGRS